MTNDPVTQSPGDSSLALHLLSMALGVAQTAVLCTAAQLGLADYVKDGPKSVAALAEATGTHLPTLTRLMVCWSIWACLPKPRRDSSPAPGWVPCCKPMRRSRPATSSC